MVRNTIFTIINNTSVFPLFCDLLFRPVHRKGRNSVVLTSNCDNSIKLLFRGIGPWPLLLKLCLGLNCWRQWQCFVVRLKNIGSKARNNNFMKHILLYVRLQITICKITKIVNYKHYVRLQKHYNCARWYSVLLPYTV